MGATEPCSSCARKFALASNILFGVLLLAMAIAGFVLRFRDEPVKEETLKNISDSARDAFGVYGFSTSNFRPITERMKQGFGIFLIVTGIVSSPLVVFGHFTFLRKRRNFLLAYVIILGLLLTIQGLVTLLFLKNPDTVQEMMRPYLREQINGYVGIHSSDQVSLGWNYLMQEYQCCGVDSSADFKSSVYYPSYCPYYNEYNAVPGCCRTLPSSYSQQRCDQWRKYCGADSYDNYIWKDGCSAALLGYYYTRNTGVIWSMIGVGLIDQDFLCCYVYAIDPKRDLASKLRYYQEFQQGHTYNRDIFLFVFAIILLKKTTFKVEPTSNSTSEVWTAGGTQRTQMGLPPTAASAPVPLQPHPVIPSTAPTQHSFHPRHVPPTLTSTAAPEQRQQVMSTTTVSQQNFFPANVPTTAASAGGPTTTQPNVYRTQPLLPGAVMLVPTSQDYARNSMQGTYTPMTTLPSSSMRELFQTQTPQAAQHETYAPLIVW